MNKNYTLKIILYEYCQNKLARAENNYIQWQNNLNYCKADQFDLLELILALNEVQVTKDIIYELQDLIKYFG